MEEIQVKSELPEFSNVVEGDLSLVPVDRRFGYQNYILYRVKLPSIEITEQTRNDILSLMDSGKNYVQLGNYTIMINSIAGIDPLPLKQPLEKELLKTSMEVIKNA